MKLSIITVNLNNREGLKKTIDSVVSQTFRDFEWIVVDGGSTDGSRELIEENAETLAYWCSEPDKGIYNAMNKGVSHAKGEYCQFLNSGDWLAADDVLEVASKKLTGADVLYGNVNLFDSDNLNEQRKYKDSFSFNDLYYGMICHNSSFIRTELLRQYPYDENLKLLSDWKLFMLLFMQNHSFEHIDTFVTCYDLNGMSSNHDDLFSQERKRIIIEFSSLILPRLMKEIDRAESHLAHLHLGDFCSICENHRLLAKLITALLLPFKK